MDRFMLDNTKVDQAYTLCTSLHHGWQQDSWSLPWISKCFSSWVRRFEVGEGIEKAANDFEAEVAATMAAALNN